MRSFRLRPVSHHPTALSGGAIESGSPEVYSTKLQSQGRGFGCRIVEAHLQMALLTD